MANYKPKLMTEDVAKEIDGLMKDGHAGALTVFGYECAAAGIDGYKAGVRNAVLTGLLVGAGVGAICRFGSYLVSKWKEKRSNEAAYKVDVS